MSNSRDRERNSRRRHRDESAVARQVGILKTHGVSHDHPAIVEPHRTNKHHAMNCGRSQCIICGNPRKLFHELTTQEQRMFQDLDLIRDRHSNGLLPPNDNENES